MKHLTLWGVLAFLVIISLAVYMAFQTGEKSPIIISGSIRLGPSLNESAIGMRTLFIILYDEQSQMPMPYGAMKESLNTDPQGNFFKFMVTPERLQMMNPTASTPQRFRVKVRLDQDGQGGADQPGDLTGSLTNIKYGSENVEIIIDQKIQN